MCKLTTSKQRHAKAATKKGNIVKKSIQKFVFTAASSMFKIWDSFLNDANLSVWPLSFLSQQVEEHQHQAQVDKFEN